MLKSTLKNPCQYYQHDAYFGPFFFLLLFPLPGVFPLFIYLFIYCDSFASYVIRWGRRQPKPNEHNNSLIWRPGLKNSTSLILRYSQLWILNNFFFFSSCWLKVHRLCNISNNTCLRVIFPLGIWDPPQPCEGFSLYIPFTYSKWPYKTLFWAFWQISHPYSLCSSHAA